MKLLILFCVVLCFTFNEGKKIQSTRNCFTEGLQSAGKLASNILDKNNIALFFSQVKVMGPPQMKKNLKFQLLSDIFQTHPPIQKGLLPAKCWKFVPNGNCKVRFFQNFKPIFFGVPKHFCTFKLNKYLFQWYTESAIFCGGLNLTIFASSQK